MVKNPVVLLVLDGFGEREEIIGNAIKNAHTPHLDFLMKENHIYLKAHGYAVGLPSDLDMGNSEVGHNALGSGQNLTQGAKLVHDAIESGDLWKSPNWNKLIEQVKTKKSVLHFIGLLSDGNIHSHIDHLLAMIETAKKRGIETIRIHILLDGRDVPARSALSYVETLESYLLGKNEQNFDAKIASGGGRMTTTMDRYGADWNMVKNGWEAHVLGIARPFYSAREAITTLRETLDLDDQNLPSFTIVDEENNPVGKIKDQDGVILFNFRGDRAMELCQAFEMENFDKFNRVYHPQVTFMSMLEYDKDAKIPENFLWSTPSITHTLTERLIEENINMFAISETQKFGHITYFWNGNRKEKFSESLETYVEIPSDRVIFSERPWMKSAEITDEILKAMETGTYGFIRANFPNGDMVGHTGNFDATSIAVEAVDLALGRIIQKAEQLNYTLIITADHGNSEDMFGIDSNGKKEIKTAHTINPVFFIIYHQGQKFTYKKGAFELANVAGTITDILGIKPYGAWKESVLYHESTH